MTTLKLAQTVLIVRMQQLFNLIEKTHDKQHKLIGIIDSIKYY